MFFNMSIKRNYKYCLIFILCYLFMYFFSIALFAETILMLPEEIELKEVNKNTNKKLVNRYKNEDQIKNQYKGKLKYKPDNDGINMYRDGKFYTTVYFLLEGFKLNKIGNNEIKSISGNSYSVTLGYYFANNFAAEVEYFELVHEISDTHIVGLNNFKMQSRNYTLGIMAESNYSRFVPFIYLGLGFAQYTYTNDIKNNFNFLFQLAGGFEIVLTDSLLISFKCKFYQPIIGMKIKYNDNNYDLKFAKEGNFSIGLKYIW